MLREVCSNAVIGFIGSAGALVAQEGIMALVVKVAKVASIGLYPAMVVGALVGGLFALAVAKNLGTLSEKTWGWGGRWGEISFTKKRFDLYENRSVLNATAFAIFIKFIGVMEKEDFLPFHSLPGLSICGGVLTALFTAIDAGKRCSTS